MAFKNYREESKGQWGQDTDALTIEQLTMGCMLRIADAVELMAKNHTDLVKKLEHEKRMSEACRTRREGAERRASALRGVITKLKKRK